MKTFNKLFATILFMLACVTMAFGQATMNSTTLTNALTARVSNNRVVLGSTSNLLAPAQAQAQGGLGSPDVANYYLIVIDREAMRVNSIPASGTVVVERGYDGTRAAAHAASAKVWVGPANYFSTDPLPPYGTCTSTQLKVLPIIHVPTGGIYQCINSVFQKSDSLDIVQGAVYSVEGTSTVAAVATGVVLVPATAGVSYTVLGAAIIPVGGTVATCTDVRIEDSSFANDVFRFLVSGTLTAILYDEASPAAQLTIGTGTAYGTAFAAGKGIGIQSTGSTCTTTTSFKYSVKYKATF